MITVEFTDKETRALLEAMRGYLTKRSRYTPFALRAHQKLLEAIHQQQGNQT